MTGTDASGNRLVFGASIPLQFGTLESVTIPLFVQRTGELARMPGPLSDSRTAPLLSPFQGQYLFVTGGTDPSLSKSSQIYDFGQFAPLPSPPTLPRAPQSIAFVGTVALLIDSQGATYFDLGTGEYADGQAPTGGSFGDVAGGQTVIADDGSEYIVGGTRTTGAETASVLVLNPSDTSNAQYPVGNLTWASLSAPRLGAAATWVSGRGVAVAGGSASAPGIEILAPLPTPKSSPLAYPPDPSKGAGATTWDAHAGTVLLAGGLGPSGGDAGARTVNLTCAASCKPSPWFGLPVAIGNTQTFAYTPSGTMAASAALVVGSEVGGRTHVFRLTSTAATEVPTKVPLTNARASVSPLGTVVVVGGASEIESFVP